MNIENIHDGLKCLVPLDEDGVDGEWWLEERVDGEYTYTHDHLGDASEHLDRLLDEFWKLKRTALSLCDEVVKARAPVRVKLPEIRIAFDKKGVATMVVDCGHLRESLKAQGVEVCDG